jgi:hypothetical protein
MVPQCIFLSPMRAPPGKGMLNLRPKLSQLCHAFGQALRKRMKLIEPEKGFSPLEQVMNAMTAISKSFGSLAAIISFRGWIAAVAIAYGIVGIVALAFFVVLIAASVFARYVMMQSKEAVAFLPGRGGSRQSNKA